MGQITNQNGLEVLVATDRYDFGEAKKDETIEYVFDFLGNADQIEYLEKSCGCSSAFFDEKEGVIRGKLDLSKANGNSEYSPGETAINKMVYVWLNDGQPRFIANHLKEKQQNPAKSWFRLDVVGKVVV